MKYAMGAMLLALGLLVPADASAYTLVMRNGAILDVGESYRLDGSRIEYRVRDGATRHVAMADVDLAATALANGETVAAFVDRATRRAVPAPAQTRSGEGAVSVTNADLEPYRAERERFDAEYRARNPYAVPPAAAVPFPSAAPAGASSTRYALERWREAGRTLRYQMDAERAQIDAIRGEIATRQARPFDYGLSYRYNFGDAPIVRSFGGYYGYYTQPQTYLRATEEFAQLNSRLIDLEIQHRATLSRWHNLLEDARRAGVPEGLLRE